VVRPLLGRLIAKNEIEVTYELVIGSRRLRAAQAAGLKTIPATLRELTDEQAMEFQIIENLQREDVAPIDEGRGYSQLIAALAKKDPKRAADGQGVKRQDLVAEIAAKVGKSARYVYARMKLCELIPELQKDLEEGRIEASHADELVRLTPKDQKAVRDGGLFLEEREHRMDDEEYVPAWKTKTGKLAISVRNLKVIIERDYQLTLDKAKFPIESAALKPLPCTQCPKNTAVNALLPPAAKPTCTDKECWRGKMRQHVEIQATGKVGSPHLVQVTLAHYSDKGVIGRDGWKTAKPGECKNVVAAAQVDVQGSVKHFQSAKRVCINKQCKIHFGAAPARTSSPGFSSSPGKKLTLEELKKHHQGALERFIEERETLEFQRRALARVEKFGESELRLVARVLAGSAWSRVNDRELAFVLGRDKPVVASVLAKEIPAKELPRLILALLFSDDNGGDLEPYARAQGIDRKKLGAEVHAGVKTCEICGCFDKHGCELGGGKRCSWMPKGAPALAGVKAQLCNNPQCVAAASERAAKSGAKPAPPAKKPAQSSAKAKPAKKAKGGRR